MTGVQTCALPIYGWGVTNSFPANTPGAFPVHTPDKIVAKCNELQENIRLEMETYDLVRWRPYHNLSTKGWNSHCDKIRQYARNYQDWYLYYCQNFINKHTNYHLSNDEMIQLFGKVGKIS